VDLCRDKVVFTREMTFPSYSAVSSCIMIQTKTPVGKLSRMHSWLHVLRDNKGKHRKKIQPRHRKSKKFSSDTEIFGLSSIELYIFFGGNQYGHASSEGPWVGHKLTAGEMDTVCTVLYTAIYFTEIPQGHGALPEDFVIVMGCAGLMWSIWRKRLWGIHMRQGVTKRFRLSLLTNSALVFEPRRGGMGGVAGSQPQSKELVRGPPELFQHFRL